MLSRPIRPRSIAACILFIGALVLFALQLRTLYTVPVYDSVRWGGDETWLMREFGNQIERGAMSYPENFGGPRRTDGVLAGSMWVDAVIYGATGSMFFPAHDYVSVGRTVTAILALILLASIYFILWKLGVSPLLASASLLLVVTSQGFVWATHSARYDLLTGLTLIWYCYYLSRHENVTRAPMFFAGIIGIAAICFSRHLLLLGFAASLAFLFRQRVWKRPALLWAWVAGSAVASFVLSIAYFAGAGEFSLFGRGGSEGSYSFVLNQIPILRPFSRNVQVSNLVERFHLFSMDAPGILVVIGISILCVLGYSLAGGQKERFSRLRIRKTNGEKFFLLCTLLCTIVWLLAEGSRPYYLFHIVPLLVIGGTLALELWSEISALIVMAVSIVFAAQHAIPSNTLGEAIARDQSATVTRFLDETPRKSLILLDVAGLDRALTDTARQVLTLDMFQPPHEASALVQKLISNHIDYVILRSSPVGTPFEPGRALLPHVLDSIGTIRDSAFGFFYDDGRSYDASMGELLDQGLDTLRLYRVR
ncbi:MAG TPA: hypothetical protein VFX22_10510 [Candidatus Kapabacteria bacterium]|nr:hypothetical protein [Candidatus Kapabacteria bacterium]